MPQDMPCYPIIHGEDWGREVINRVVGEVLRRGHNGGIVWQGTSDLTDYILDHQRANRLPIAEIDRFGETDELE